MNFKQFKYVLVLSEEKSFSKAADVLKISQPALSQYIKNLEKELHAELFYRDSGNLNLTDAGAAYLKAGNKIIDAERELRDAISNITDSQTISINIGVGPHIARSFMPTVVKEFKHLYPNIKLVIEERNRNSLVEGMRHGEFDFSIMARPLDETDFTTEHLLYEDLVLAVSGSSDPFMNIAKAPQTGSGFSTIDIHALSGADMVVLSEEQNIQRHLDKACIEYGVAYKTAVEVRSVTSAFAMMRAGIGHTLIPLNYSYVDTANKNVHFYAFEQNLERRDVVAFYRKGQRLSPAVRSLILLIKKNGTNETD